MKSMLLPEVLNNQFDTKRWAGLWEMAPYGEPSVGPHCWQARHCTAVVARSALVGRSSCFWAHSELPTLTQWLFHFWASCASAGMGDNRGWLPLIGWVVLSVWLFGDWLFCGWMLSFCLHGHWNVAQRYSYFLSTSLGPSIPEVGKVKPIGQIHPLPVWNIKLNGNKTMLICLHIVCNCFCAITTELNSCKSSHTARKSKTFALTLYRKSFQILCLHASFRYTLVPSLPTFPLLSTWSISPLTTAFESVYVFTLATSLPTQSKWPDGLPKALIFGTISPQYPSRVIPKGDTTMTANTNIFWWRDAGSQVLSRQFGKMQQN